MSIEYSIVIPVYNSTDSVKILVEQLEEVFLKTIKKSYEIILVDDGSPNPQTWPTLQEIYKSHDNVIAIQLMRNFGKEGALLAGFSISQGRYVITMDDDLQHSPYDIPKMVEKQDHDVVIAAFKRKRHTFMQRLTSEMRVWFEVKYLGRPRHIKMTPFKLIKKEIVEQILSIQTAYPYTSGFIYYITKDIVNISATHHPRKYGRSNFNMRRRWRVFLNLLINNTPFLLKMMIRMGFLITGLSFLLGTYFIIMKILHKVSVSGWTTIVVLLTFFSGVIIFFLGVIGEYILRILNTVEHKPAFIIKHKLTKHENSV